EGSIFTVRLPARVKRPVKDATIVPTPAAALGLATAAMPAAVAAAVAASPAGDDSHPSKGTVLVIDDDPSACELMVRSLSKEGFHVLTANEGVDGLRMAREARP